MASSLSSVFVRLGAFAASFLCIGCVLLLLSVMFVFNVHGSLLPLEWVTPTLVVTFVLVAIAAWRLARAAGRAFDNRL